MSYSNKIGVVVHIIMSCCYLAINISCLVQDTPQSRIICNRTLTNISSFNIFSANLQSLYNNAVNNAPRYLGYYYYTYPRGNHENMAYGVSFCQADLSYEDCQFCVTRASQYLASNCRYNDNLQVAWFEGCMVRYDSNPFFSDFTKEDEGLSFLSYTGDQNVIEEAEFYKVFNSTMTELTNRASEGNLSSTGFTYESRNISSQHTLYALVQCISALAEAECARCLRMAINLIEEYNNWQGGRALVGNCMARYERHLFYRNLLPPLPPPPPSPPLPPPPPPTPSPNKDKTDLSFGEIIGIIIAGIVAFVLLCVTIITGKDKITGFLKNISHGVIGNWCTDLWSSLWPSSSS